MSHPNKWLMGTSTLIALPSILLYKLHYVDCAFLVFTSGIVSVNYWKNPIKSVRKKLDIFMSRFTIGYMMIRYPYHTKVSPYTILLFLCAGLKLYQLSCNHHSTRNPVWEKYHFAFHISIVLAELQFCNTVYKTNSLYTLN